MASILPPVPRLVFSILEPLSILGGVVGAVFDPKSFVAAQLPATSQDMASYALTPTNRVLVLQLGNMFGLVGMIGVGLLYATNEPKVIWNYQIACAIGDLGHVAAIYSTMGHTDFVDVAKWNVVVWASVGFTAVLFTFRVLYLAGLLGEDRPVQDAKGKLRRNVRKDQ